MATSTVGTADLVAALTGGGAIENAAYAQQANRILDAQNKQAMLDKRVLDANLARDIMRGRGNFERNSMDLPDMVRFAVMGDMADQLKYGQEAIGVDQKNQGMQQIMDMAKQAGEEGVDPADIVNMIVSAIYGKQLGPGNVNVAGQAQADIAKTAAETSAAAALTSKRGAETQYDLARTAGEGGVGVPKVEGISDFHEDMLYQMPATIPIEFDNPGWFTGNTTKAIPFDDPRAQKAWSGMSEDEQAALMRDFGPDFLQWRQANLATRPELADASIAIGVYLSEKMSDPTTANVPTPGAEGVGKNRASIYNNMTDEELLAEYNRRVNAQ